MKGLKARKLYRYISFPLTAPAVNLLYMSRSSWHVVSLTWSCQSSFCTASNELSVDKVFKYSQSPQISDAIGDLRSASCDFINFPSLPPSSPTRCRVGWSDSVPVAFAHVHENCRHFVLFPVCGKIRKTNIYTREIKSVRNQDVCTNANVLLLSWEKLERELEVIICIALASISFHTRFQQLPPHLFEVSLS